MPDCALAASCKTDRAESLYDHVEAQLATLITLLGLQGSSAEIRRAFALVCGASLALRRNEHTMRASRLNADGTPFQIGLTLGDDIPPLQFLSEPTRMDASNTERLAAAREAIAGVFPLFGVRKGLAEVHAWLDRVAPAGDPVLRVDDAGPVWLGCGFAAAGAPRLKIYVNASWGPPRDRWLRLDSWAEYVGVPSQWSQLRRELNPALEPLGMAVTLSADAEPEGRVYFRVSGMTLADHEAQAALGGSLALRAGLRALNRQLLARDAAFAMRSAVCSFGLRAGAEPAFKLEVCAHCAFASDADARRRCSEWLADGGFDATPYVRIIDALSAGRPSVHETRLHSFVGIGAHRGATRPTIYLNPSATS